MSTEPVEIVDERPQQDLLNSENCLKFEVLLVRLIQESTLPNKPDSKANLYTGGWFLSTVVIRCVKLISRNIKKKGDLLLLMICFFKMIVSPILVRS